MGVWNETCGISRLPLLPGEKSVMVVIDMVSYLPNENDEYKLTKKYISRIDNLSDFFYSKIDDIVCFEKGKYDWYGLIEGMCEKIKEDIHEKSTGSGEYLKLMFSEKYWDIVLANSEEIDADDYEHIRPFFKKSKIEENKLKEIYRVMTNLFAHRINPDTSLFGGSQAEEYKLHKIILPEIVKDVEYRDLVKKLGYDYDVDDAVEILKLFYKWYDETRFHSNLDKVKQHKIFNKLISKYPHDDLISVCIAMLKEDMFRWNTELILSEIVVPYPLRFSEDETGSFECLKKKWLEWWDKKCQK